MKKSKNKTNWIIDVVLFCSLILAFFLDLTGLQLHQWVGVAVGVLAIYHLDVHWDWVEAVTVRLFKGATRKTRLFYLVDAGLLIGFIVILVTGFLISTWLGFPVESMSSLVDLHIQSSIATLLLVVFKIAIHWRWIIKTAKRYVFSTALPVMKKPAQVYSKAATDRREFLKLMGLVGAAAFLAALSALDADNEAQAVAPSEPSPETPPPSQTPVLSQLDSAASPTSVPLDGDGQILAESPSPTPPSTTLTPSPTVSSSPPSLTTNCVVRCNKRCSYPGRCRRYVDANGNNLCDLGECI